MGRMYMCGRDGGGKRFKFLYLVIVFEIEIFRSIIISVVF